MSSLVPGSQYLQRVGVTSSTKRTESVGTPVKNTEIATSCHVRIAEGGGVGGGVTGSTIGAERSDKEKQKRYQKVARSEWNIESCLVSCEPQSNPFNSQSDRNYYDPNRKIICSSRVE